MPLQHLATGGGLQEVKSDVMLKLRTALMFECEQPRTRTVRIGAHSPVLSPVASQEVKPTTTAGAIFAQAFALTVRLKVRGQILDDLPESLMALEARVYPQFTAALDAYQAANPLSRLLFRLTPLLHDSPSDCAGVIGAILAIALSFNCRGASGQYRAKCWSSVVGL
jgi:hypothetical protein